MASSELTTQLELVRRVARQHLAMFARTKTDNCREAYLFKDDHFCGIKIVLGNFQARWEVGRTTVAISRADRLLQTVSLDSESAADSSPRRAA